VTFQIDGIEYKACWKDIRGPYEIDCQTQLKMTKLTNTSVFLKVLQRQSILLVCTVFDDKTIAAFETVKDKLSYHPGTVKLTDIRLRDVKRAP